MAKSSLSTIDPNAPTINPNAPTVDPNAPTVDPNAPTVDPNAPTADPNAPVTDPPTPPNLPPDNFKELSILQSAYELQKYPKKEPSPEWERVQKYAHKVHSMYFNRLNLNKHDSDLLLHLFSNYFNGIVNVWIKNDESITKSAFIENLQLILKICTRIRRLRICNKTVTRHTVPPREINKCTALQTIVFESCTINELDILRYTNLSAIHLLYCEITGDILNGHLKKIRLIKCKCDDQDHLAQILSTRVVTTDESTNELKEIDFQEALQVAKELPTKDVLLYRLDSTDEFILAMEDFVSQNGPYIGHMLKPLQKPSTIQPGAGSGQTGGTASQGSGGTKSQAAASLQGPPQLLHGTEDFLTYKPLK